MSALLDVQGRDELSRQLWGFRREFVLVGLVSCVINALMLVPTLYMLQVYDRILISRNALTLVAVSLITLFLLAVMSFAERLRSKVLVHAGLRLDEALSSRVFNASFDSYLQQASSGPARAFGDLIQVRQFLTGNGVIAFFDVPWAPIYIGALFFMHPWLGWAGIGFALVQALLAWLGHRHAASPAQEASEATSEARAYLHGKLRNAELLESMGMVHNLRAHWGERHLQTLGVQSLSQSVSHRIGAWSKFVRYMQSSLALAAGAVLVIQGELSPGGMIASNVLIARALAPIDLLANTWRPFLSARSAYERLRSLLREFPQRDPRLHRVAPTGALLLRDVVALGSGRAEPILKGVSMHAAPGSVTVVLGPSGSGKSTLARAMMGIWPQLSGEVLLDERPLGGWDRSELGPYLGYLPQDVELFEGSIAENIARFGEMDSNKVIAAAQAAGLHEMILRFPQGYDTQVGESGGILSGGQRQRLGLARAIYGDPVLVVLDEPNANLDDVGEQALVRVVVGLKQRGCTVVLVTHRPLTLAVADQVLVLRNGQVQAFGPRDAVMKSLRAAPAQAVGQPAVQA